MDSDPEPHHIRRHGDTFNKVQFDAAATTAEVGEFVH